VGCTKGSTATVGLLLGDTVAGSSRRRINGTDFLIYELYKESARTNLWGKRRRSTLDLPQRRMWHCRLSPIVF